MRKANTRGATAVLTAAAVLGLAGASAPAGEPLNPGQLLYDEAQRRLLMLGAYQLPELPELTQLWEWQATGWKLLPAASAPSMRTLSTAVYDSGRRRIVMYGGLGNRGLQDPRGDTWEFDGQRWVPIADRTVGTRDHHAMAYDEARGRTVMYGGVSSIDRSSPGREAPINTWEWDGARWTEIVTTGPGPRGGPGMVYDRARKHVVLFGGIGIIPGAAPRFADTWIWDGKNWLKASDGGPAARNGHAMAFDRRAGVVIMWGGTTGVTHLDDMWQWDGKRWTEIRLGEPRPSKRVGAQMVYDVAREMIVLYGGRIRVDGVVRTSDEMWEWHGDRWTRVQVPR